MGLRFPPIFDVLLVGRGFGGSPDCPFDCSEHTIIYPATAQVACQLGPNLAIGWVRVPVEQGFGSDDHARGAVAALDGLFFNEGLLKRVQIVGRSEAL